MTGTLEAARREFARRISSDDPLERETMVSITTYENHQDRYVVPVYSETTIREVIEALPDEDVGDVILVVLDELRCKFIGAHREDDDRTNLRAFLRDLDSLEDVGPVDRDQLRWVNSPIGETDRVTQHWRGQWASMTPRATGWRAPRRLGTF